ncbi:hypothetical protein TNCT_359291 [Trichonephila clavata]|uniref:Uncharacterized protein n=1 Tax=Trichonephila clavata TaxID=2740835 RepID=A0A8X6KSW4_TRICU|nr:hypothetical protein TNCT_359291 [Trichonephila clavata]
MRKRINEIEKSFQPVLLLFHITGLESYPNRSAHHLPLLTSKGNQLPTPSLLEEEVFLLPLLSRVSQPTKDKQKPSRRGSERPNRLRHCHCRPEDGQFESRHEHSSLTKSCVMLG